MADKFRVGQRVRLIKTYNAHQQKGHVFTIESARKSVITKERGCVLAYRVNGGFAMEDQLEPFYDGEEQSSWSECAWKPKPIVHSIEDEITTDTGGE
jgi:hypothetical protein